MDKESYGDWTSMYHDWQANISIIEKHEPTNPIINDKDKILLNNKKDGVFFKDHQNLELIDTLYSKYDVHRLMPIYSLFKVMTNKASTIVDELENKVQTPNLSPAH